MSNDLFSETSTPIEEFHQQLIQDPVLIEVMGKALDDLEFNQERYQDPIYLSYARWIASELLYISSRDVFKLPTQMPLWVEWHKAQGEILDWSEVLLIHDMTVVKLPRPFDVVNPRDEYRYDSILGAAVQIDMAINEGIPVGFTSGVWDLLHMNHMSYLYEAAKFLSTKHETRIHLAVGVDLSELVRDYKGPHRPLLGFKHRISTLCNVPFIANVFPVMTFTRYTDSKIDPTDQFIPFLYLGASNMDQRLNKEQLINEGKRFRRQFPEWYQRSKDQLFYFYGAGDPRAELKKIYADAIGATAVQIEIPFHDAIHTTDLEKRFRVRQITEHDHLTDPWSRDFQRRIAEM